MKSCKYESAKIGDLGGDLVMGAVVLIGGYFLYQKLFGDGGPEVPKTTSTWSGSQIPVSTDPTSANTASAGKENAVDWIANYLQTRGVTDPLGAGPFTANPDASTMDYDTLTALAAKINDAGAPWYSGLTKSGGDWSAVYNVIQQYCTNQVDVSNLAVAFQEIYGQDLLNWMYTPDNMANGAIHAGISNVEGVQKIIQYALALPPQ